jgi:hypothetical protein
MKRDRALIAMVGWLSLGLPALGGAQVPAPASDLLPRPYRGVYGGNSANNAGLAHSFDGTLSLWGGSDQNTGPESGFSDPEQSIGGPYSAGGAAFSYAWRGRTVAFGANASSQSRYYPEMRDFLAGWHSGGAGVEASLGSKTRIQAQQAIAVTPLFAVNPFPVLGIQALGESVPPSTDLALAQRDTRLFTTTAGFSHVLGARTSLGGGYAFNSSVYSGEVTDLRAHTAIVRWDRQVARNGFLAGVYNFRHGEYDLNGDVALSKIHEAALELGRQWVHSRTRRTGLRVSVGAAVVDAENTRLTRPVAGFQFSSMLGQSWDVFGSYRRGVEQMPGLADVTYVDTLGLSVGGLLTSRVDASVQASYATGDVGFGDARNRYTAYTGIARLGFAVHRTAALFAEGFVYSTSYNALPDAGAVGGLQDRERLGFRAGMSWWLPIIRERRPGGTR